MRNKSNFFDAKFQERDFNIAFCLCLVFRKYCVIFNNMSYFFFSGNVCWIGHFCPEGTASPLPCAPGTYMNHTQAAVCYTCPPGHYCIDQVSPEPCPAGKVDCYFNEVSK